MVFIHICHLSFAILYFYRLSTTHYRNYYRKSSIRVELFSFILYRFSSFLRSCITKTCGLLNTNCKLVQLRISSARNQDFAAVFSGQKGIFSHMFQAPFSAYGHLYRVMIQPLRIWKEIFFIFIL